MMAGRANRQVEQPQKADQAEQPAIGAGKKLAEFQLAAFGSTSTDFFKRTFRELLDEACARSRRRSTVLFEFFRRPVLVEIAPGDATPTEPF
jgi:hypothetical protein